MFFEFNEFTPFGPDHAYHLVHDEFGIFLDKHGSYVRAEELVGDQRLKVLGCVVHFYVGDAHFVAQLRRGLLLLKQK